LCRNGFVPYDSYLYFHGEEQSLAIRAFTRGWDIYHPIWIPLYHLYKKANTEHQTHHWHKSIKNKRSIDYQALQQRAYGRVYRLLCGDGLRGSAYGLGNERTLDDYKKISGIDYSNKIIIPIDS